MSRELQNLPNEQLILWEMVQKNYDALKRVCVEEVEASGCLYKVQFNPARIVSLVAKVDSKSIQERKCFPCPAHLPPIQKGIPFGDHYQILVNLFPIFPRHLIIPELQHIDQRILYRFVDMFDLANRTKNYIISYNGPQCGALAPDHMHFQAGSKGFLPIEQERKEKRVEKIITNEAATLWALDDSPRIALLIESESKEAAVTLFNAVYGAMNLKPGEEEPMMNVLAWRERGKRTTCTFPRARHCPACHIAQGDTNILISPASVDMDGVSITPLEKDFEKITANDIADTLSKVYLKPADFRALIERIKQRS